MEKFATTAAYESNVSDKMDMIFRAASDAAFADCKETRKSTQGSYVEVARMLMFWESTLQRSVTKSTTEPELMALSFTASEMLSWIFLFAYIGFKFDGQPTLYCDNLQTVRVANKDAGKLKTRLKHVDIHQYWLRQATATGQLNVEWIPTGQMPTDGLTKALGRQKHVAFLQQLGIEEISSRVKGKREED
jgi:hypothetical protein